MPRANRFDQLLDQWNPVLRRAFMDSIYALRDAGQVDLIAKMLERGDVEGAIRAAGLDPVHFRPFDKAISSAFEAGGGATAAIIPVQRLADGFRVKVQFKIRNPLAEQWLSQRSSTQVTAILDDQRSMIRNYLTAGMRAGDNPRTTALNLVGRINSVTGRREGGVIGLTDSQAQWVRAYSDELASDNPLDALARNLRDKRFDAAVKAAGKDGKPISADLRNKMVTAYTNRALRYRAETIGRTESMAALHESQQQAIEQAVSSGAIAANTVMFTWRTARDNRVRDSHAAMEGQEVPLGQPFVTGNGVQLEFPGDPNGPPEEIINCRCWREPSVDFLAGLD